MSVNRVTLSLVLMVLTLLAYLNSFPGQFHFDDYPLMLESPRVTGDSFPYLAFLDQYGGRPLTLWTFHLNHRFFGVDPFSYHLVNVFLHLLVVTGLFLLLARLTARIDVAFFGALLFAVHPLQTFTVNYIWARSVLLMSGCGLAALLLATRRPGWAALLIQLAVWSRFEAVAFLPLLWFLRRDRWWIWLSLAVFNLGTFANGLISYSPRDFAFSHPDWTGYWLTQGLVFWRYLGWMVWPSGLAIDHAAGPVSWLMGLLCWVSLLLLVLAALAARRASPLMCGGFLWIVFFSLPGMLVPNSDLINESRTYLPMAGVALMVGGWPRQEGQRVGAWVGRVAMGLVLILLVSVTLQRNRLWQDDVALWREAAELYPDKARARYNYAVALTRSGFLQEAQREFEAAVFLDPGDDVYRAALGYCAELRQQWARAELVYRRALDLNPDNRYARGGLIRIEKKLRHRKGGSL